MEDLALLDGGNWMIVLRAYAKLFLMWGWMPCLLFAYLIWEERAIKKRR